MQLTNKTKYRLRFKVGDGPYRTEYFEDRYSVTNFVMGLLPVVRLTAVTDYSETPTADTKWGVPPEMPAFRVHKDDGTNYITSMAMGTTLEQARAYFVGQRQTNSDETTFTTVTSVEQV